MNTQTLDLTGWLQRADGLGAALSTQTILFAVSLLLLAAAIVALLGPRRYVRQESLFTPAELRMRRTLEAALGERYGIYAKVRMVDLIKPAGKEGRRGWWRAFRRISSKHIDFVLTEHDGALLLAIELDDASHERRERRARDRLVDRAFAEAGLPLLRIPARRSGDVAWLRREVATRGLGS